MKDNSGITSVSKRSEPVNECYGDSPKVGPVREADFKTIVGYRPNELFSCSSRANFDLLLFTCSPRIPSSLTYPSSEEVQLRRVQVRNLRLYAPAFVRPCQ
jgi:hypothetical protein